MKRLLTTASAAMLTLAAGGAAQAQNIENFTWSGTFEVVRAISVTEGGATAVEGHVTYTMTWNGADLSGEATCFFIAGSVASDLTLQICDVTDSDGDQFAFDSWEPPVGSDDVLGQGWGVGVGKSGKYEGRQVTLTYQFDAANTDGPSSWSGGGSFATE